MSEEKPKIACLPNGPYYLLNDMNPKVVPNIFKSNGDPCHTVGGVALCRCGGSKNKPFCDGTHGTNGFTDKKLADRTANKREPYIGKKITIHDDRGVCAHIGNCTDNLKSVFKLGVEPWIDPDGAAVEEIIETIKSCPSGALSYSIEDVEHNDFAREPKVTTLKNGPYSVVGGIELLDQEMAEGTASEHYTLCRCGGSRNKPFCDGTHWSIGFKDEKN